MVNQESGQSYVMEWSELCNRGQSYYQKPLKNLGNSCLFWKSAWRSKESAQKCSKNSGKTNVFELADLKFDSENNKSMEP